MKQCQLCRNAAADMKNAHLIPHFLIKTATNYKGSTDRDTELTFSIPISGFVDVFYGRNISPETIGEMSGKGLSDEEIAEMENPFIRDELVCRGCEKKIAIIENYVSSKIYRVLMQEQYTITQRDAKGAGKIEFPTVDTSLYYLFVYSIFWRCSVANFNGFHLQPKIEESLRTILQTYLGNNLEEMAGLPAGQIGKFPIISTFSEHNDSEDPTGNFIALESTRFPYFLVANRMTFQLFEKERQVKSSQFSLKGLSRYLEKGSALMHHDSPILIAILSSKQAEDFRTINIQELGEQYIRSKIEDVKRIHKRLISKEAPQSVLQLFVNHFSIAGISFGERYSFDHFKKCVLQAFLDYGYNPVCDPQYE